MPAQPPLLRAWAVLVFGALLLWTSLEDSSAFAAALGGWIAALTLASLWITRRFGGQALQSRAFILMTAVMGGIVGALAAVLSAGLMLLKNGLHAHAFPDYPFGMIIDMLARAPLWAVAGLLLGAAVGLVWGGKQQEAG